jgi:hypothetical protein
MNCNMFGPVAAIVGDVPLSVEILEAVVAH